MQVQSQLRECAAKVQAVAVTDSKNMRLFQCGFVQKSEIAAGHGIVFYRVSEPRLKITDGGTVYIRFLCTPPFKHLSP